MISEDSSILSEYGVGYSEDDNEVTLSFTYERDGIPLEWDFDILSFIHSIFIKDKFCEFISGDDEEIIYLFKGKSIKKRLSSSFQGIIDVTFELYDNLGYKREVTTIEDVSSEIIINNPSNIGVYKPTIILKDITSEKVEISNLTNNIVLDVNNITPNSTIVIDNEVCTINSVDKNYLSSSNRNWIVLDRGINELSINGQCKVEIHCMYPFMI